MYDCIFAIIPGGAKNRKEGMNKTLKLNHRLAEDIKRNIRALTWCIYDDKKISVNDEVELIDKVDPMDLDSWMSIGRAYVRMVVEKRLGDISQSELEEYGMFTSREEALNVLQKEYGPEITYETPVKIIYFELTKLKKTHHTRAPNVREAKLFADGGSRGNPGPSATGFTIQDMDNNIVVTKGTYLGITTNNQAEYQALKMGLEEALSLNVRILHVFMDSMLVVNQMKGIFKVKNRDLWPIYESIKGLLPRFERVSFSHVPRELNKVADAAVNKVLDTEERSQ